MRKLVIVGNVGTVQPIKFVGDGDNKRAVLNFTVASHFRKGNGERGTEWTNAAIWGERAEKLAPSITSGVGLYVEGPVSADAFIKSDEPRASLNVTVDVLVFTTGKKEESASAESDEQS